MSLQRMDTLMLQARAEKIAIGAFECWESLNIQAIAKAAAHCRKPVIFQASPAEYNTMGGPDALADMVRFYVNKYNICSCCFNPLSARSKPRNKFRLRQA